MSSRAVIALAGSALIGSVAHAAILESEVNNTRATANTLTPAQQALFDAANALVFDGSITPASQQVATADVDYLCFTLQYQSFFTASLFMMPSSPLGAGAIGLFNASGTGLAAAEWTTTNGTPSFSVMLNPGTYYIAVSSHGDYSISGGIPGSEPDGRAGNAPSGPGIASFTADFQYKLVLGYNAVPTPGTAALMGLGGIVAARRRR